MFTYVFFITILIGFNAFFTAAEYALLGLRKSKIDQYVRENIIGFTVVRKALDNLHIIIPTTQLGSTACNILIGLIAEPIIERYLLTFIGYGAVAIPASFGQPLAIAITLIMLSFIQMVLGEIVPKTIALQKAATVARVLIVPLNFFSKLFSPLIIITNKVSSIFLKIMRMKPYFENNVDYSKEEIQVIVDESIKRGIIPDYQARLLKNIMALQQTPASKLVVKKTELKSFFHDEEVDNIKNKISKNNYSYNRYPVFMSKDMIIGYVHISDILRFPVNGSKHTRLNQTNLIRKILYTYDKEPLDVLLNQMHVRGVHAAVVTNDAEKHVGLLTLDNIVDFLVGHK